LLETIAYDGVSCISAYCDGQTIVSALRELIRAHTDLHISHSTAKTRLLRVYEKLEAPNRSAAVATALAHGLLRLSSTAPERYA
jgi:hypothetical protein